MLPWMRSVSAIGLAIVLAGCLEPDLGPETREARQGVRGPATLVSSAFTPEGWIEVTVSVPAGIVEAVTRGEAVKAISAFVQYTADSDGSTVERTYLVSVADMLVRSSSASQAVLSTQLLPSLDPCYDEPPVVVVALANANGAGRGSAEVVDILIDQRTGEIIPCLRISRQDWEAAVGDRVPPELLVTASYAIAETRVRVAETFALALDGWRVVESSSSSVVVQATFQPTLDPCYFEPVTGVAALF